MGEEVDSVRTEVTFSNPENFIIEYARSNSFSYMREVTHLVIAQTVIKLRTRY